MAIITLNKNSVEPLGISNMGLSTEQGDSWNTVITNLNTMLVELYGNSGTIASANRRGSVIDLSSNVAAFSSANTNTSQTMFTYTLPASTLVTTGAGLYVDTWGSVANNAASKSVILNIGGVSLSTGSFTSAAVAYSLDAYYMRTGASAQTALLEGWAGSTRVASKASTDTSVETGTITITAVCTDASAASANVLGNGLIVQFLP